MSNSTASATSPVPKNNRGSIRPIRPIFIYGVGLATAELLTSGLAFVVGPEVPILQKVSVIAHNVGVATAVVSVAALVLTGFDYKVKIGAASQAREDSPDDSQQKGNKLKPGSTQKL